jgi:dihydrofolate reductase
MAHLICMAITSLDGYVADEQENFDWSTPTEEVHTFVNDLERPVGTHLYGRRMYEVVRYWQTAGDEPDEPAFMKDYAEIWRAADKVVYSRTLPSVDTPRTRLEREFDPDAVRAMKESAERDLSVSGPHLADEAFRAGLVDEVQLFVNPVVVGGGNRALPGGLRMDLELVDEHRFGNGVVFLRYRVTR